MKNKQNLIGFLLFIVVAFALDLFELRIMQDNTLKAIKFVILGGAIVLSLPFVIVKFRGFSLAIHLMCLAILISFVMAKVSWDQNYLDSFKVCLPFMMWFLYFFLLHHKVPLKTLENIMVIYGLIYMILYIFQFLNSQTVYFGWIDSYGSTRGIVRILFPGGGVFFLGFFIALNKYTEKEGNKSFWLLFIIAGCIVTLMQVTRQNIIVLIIVIVYHLMRNQALYKKLLIIFFISGPLLIFLNSDNPIVNGLIKNQEKGNSFDTKNVRVEEADFFINRDSPYDYNRVFGNGVPYYKTRYGVFDSVNQKKGFFYTDVGIIGVYVLFGILAVIADLLIFVKGFSYKVPQRYMYLKYYLFFLLVTCLTSEALFNENFLIADVFAVY